MKRLHAIFTILRGIGYFGSGMLFLYIEWTYLYPNWVQLLDPAVHLQVLNSLLATPLFWLFLAMAAVGHYGAIRIRQRLEKQQHRPQERIERRELQKVASTSSGASARATAGRQPDTVRQSPVSEVAPRTVFQKVLQADAATKQKLELLEWAIQSSQKVEFDYENRYGARSHRLIIPIEFQIVGQTLCLTGYCRLRKAKRTFAIQRMTGIKLIAANPTDYLLQASWPNSASLDSSEQDTASLRPFIQYQVDELERIANLEWHNREVLEEIQEELNFRTRKKACNLREQIARRLLELQKISRPSARMPERS